MINILEIPGQYFFVWDRTRHEAAINGLKLVEDIESEDSAKNRERLHQRIVPVVGFRQAERLKDAKPEEVRETLQVVRERQQYLKGYLEERFETGASRAGTRYPENFGEQEVRRDAVFYTLTRSGLIVISDALGEQTDWEKASGEILNGERLDRYLPPEVTEITQDLLPRAILFNQQRNDLKSRLREYGLSDDQLRQLDKALPNVVNLDLPEEQKQQAQVLLQRCIGPEADFEREFGRLTEQLQLDQQEATELKQKLKKVVRGSAFRLARGLYGLKNGRIDDGALNSFYTTGSIHKWFGLGRDISELGLTELDIDHVHTRNVRYVTSIINNHLSGWNGLPTKLIEHLGIEDASSWHTQRNTFLDPVLEPDPETLGLYVGHFLFGHGSATTGSYSPKDKGREQFLDLLERSGKLNKDLYVNTKTSGEISEDFRKQIKNPDKVVKKYTVPLQIFRLAKHALERCQDREFYMSALRGWLVDRYTPERRCLGGGITMKRNYEDLIRTMASVVGLNVSDGYEMSERSKHVYVRNPEIVGYRPERS
ncbi:MAG: hypothetical protein HY512_02065 [Candidatus Aenigmarchaeota archaeon]|nr:hypothetical protein [Candidatus Aenigmarchaeota archaeon]